MRLIRPEPLTAAAFAPYGDVIEADFNKSRLINEGTTRRFHALATAEAHEGGSVIMSVFRAVARPLPIAIRLVERHPLGSQAFIPMERRPWLVVVSEEPTPESVRAFWARGDQGVNYRAGTWHHPLLVLDAAQDFLVVDRAGSGNNLEERYFSKGDALAIEIP